jgi:type IX secretion system PorP/SprF family membrane protein
MKHNIKFLYLLLLLPAFASAQSDQHYTMFMYNKLLYNPAYTGSRDVVSANGVYRDQWDGINGAPKTFSATIDAPVGSYMLPFHKVALGLSFTNEQVGVEQNQNIVAYYAYRIKLETSVLSFGLQAGAKLYTANYSQLNPYQQNDLNLTHDIKNVFLPNFGAGAYWSGENFYAGLSVPNILQNYYDEKERKINNERAREIRGYYLSGGYVIPVSENFQIEPQVMGRYAGNATYQLPFNADLNVSAIIYQRFLFAVTYRTDKSVEGIVHVQATKNINIGYAYDYLMSALQGYNNGSHELVIGFDFIREHAKFTTPRFVKSF